MDSVISKHTITFVVVYRDEELNLPELLNSISTLLTEQANEKTSFLFVNNNSTDRSEKVVNEWLSKNNVKGKNINRAVNNMGAARQQSLEESGTPWVVFIDADSVLEESWFDAIFKVIADADKKTCAIGGCSLYALKEKWHAFVPPLWNYFPLGKKPGRKIKVFHVPTNNYLLNKEMALTAGGFDSFFGQVGEDLDLNVRLNWYGDVYYDPRLIVTHKLPNSILLWYSKMALYGRAQSTVFMKYFGFVAVEKVIPTLFLIFIVSLIFCKPEAALLLITISLLIERVRFYFLTFLFYGLGEFVGFIKAIIVRPRYMKAPIKPLKGTFNQGVEKSQTI